jgi:alpha-galactosidase
VTHLHLRDGGTSLLMLLEDHRLPRVLHWGDDLGPLDDAQVRELARALTPQHTSNATDDLVAVELLPQQSRGWLGTPGLSGSRSGAAFSAAFETTDVQQDNAKVAIDARDGRTALQLTLDVDVTPQGLVRTRATLTTDGDADYQVDQLLLALPVPADATEILDLTGRHVRERSPQRHGFTRGTHRRDSRRGRTGADATLVLCAGEDGFGFRRGRVWGLHVAWSGNHTTLAEADPAGVRVLAGGELLLPGEVRLAPGASYSSPWLVASHGDGLDAMSARFHEHLRARPHHPRSPRPVTLNTWEAVYFDHDLERLTVLADRAHAVGVERFVLDDGWFRHRRDDRAGLGDWYVDEQVWPDGLHPLVDHVRGLGMQMGLWVEPEMVNRDSDLAREHPDWVLAPDGRDPMPFRHQQVLDLTRADAFEHVLGRLDALVAEHALDYLKWDHNRDLIEAGTGDPRRPAVHRQTLAVYALLDELRRRHPGLEIESCASGGSRVDLEILERTDRVWGSDNLDPLERQQVERWTGLLAPPELVGSHIGAPVSETTGRHTSLALRASTALFGHLGIEWDLAAADDDELAELRGWVALHQRLRSLLHTGTVVRGDHPDESLWLHGVVSADRGHAVFALAQRVTSVQAPAGVVRLPGLDDATANTLTPLAPTDLPLPWWRDGLELSGRLLGQVGVQAPTLRPETTALVELTAVE